MKSEIDLINFIVFYWSWEEVGIFKGLIYFIEGGWCLSGECWSNLGGFIEGRLREGYLFCIFV